MKNVTKIIVSAALLATLVAGSVAQATKPAPKAEKCSACGMTLGVKKSDKTPIAVKGKTGKIIGYCCAGCKMNKK